MATSILCWFVFGWSGGGNGECGISGGEKGNRRERKEIRSGLRGEAMVGEDWFRRRYGSRRMAGNNGERGTKRRVGEIEGVNGEKQREVQRWWFFSGGGEKGDED
ncbi:hypothetical protein HAX54_025899, partial [Datura stramonium]|nr:hypothetical protein [Datura stramonium]